MQVAGSSGRRSAGPGNSSSGGDSDLTPPCNLFNTPYPCFNIRPGPALGPSLPAVLMHHLPSRMNYRFIQFHGLGLSRFGFAGRRPAFADVPSLL